jgi:hypothetical protein
MHGAPAFGWLSLLGRVEPGTNESYAQAGKRTVSTVTKTRDRMQGMLSLAAFNLLVERVSLRRKMRAGQQQQSR